MVRRDALRRAPAPSGSQGVEGGNPARASAVLGQAGLAMQVEAAVKGIEAARGP